MKFKVSRRGVALGILFCIAATVSGVVVIRYTEAFYLGVIFWVVATLMLLQFIRWVRRVLRGG